MKDEGLPTFQFNLDLVSAFDTIHQVVPNRMLFFLKHGSVFINIENNGAKKKCLVTTLSGVGDNHDCYDF